METEMLLIDYISSLIIVVFSSFIGSLIKDIYSTLINKEEAMSFKKIFISWITAVVAMFALISQTDIYSNQFLLIAISFGTGAFGYFIFEFILSEKGKKLLLKILVRKISESTLILNEIVNEEKEEDK